MPPPILNEQDPFIAKIPFNSFLGLKILRAHPDGVTLRCKVSQELLNSHGALQGGVTASHVDADVGVAIQHRFRWTHSIDTQWSLRSTTFLVTTGAVLARVCSSLDPRSVWAESI